MRARWRARGAAPFLAAPDADGNAAFTAGSQTAALNVDARGTGVQVAANFAGFSLKLAKKTGALTGRFTDPATGRRITFGGALLDGQRLGSGFLLRDGRSERVKLAPQP